MGNSTDKLIQSIAEFLRFSAEGDEAGAGAPDPKAGAPGGSEDEPKTYEVKLPDGTRKDVPLEELATVYGNSESLVDERVNAEVDRLKQSYKADVAKAAQELAKEMVGEQPKSAKEEKPTAPKTPIQPSPAEAAIEIPDFDKLDLDDDTRKAIVGLQAVINQQNTTLEGYKQLFSQLEGLPDNLKDVTPESIQKLVTDYGNQAAVPIAQTVLTAIQDRERRQQEETQAVKNVNDTLLEKFPQLHPNVLAAEINKIKKAALTTHRLYEIQRMQALRTNPKTAPPELSLAQIMKDELADRVESLTGMIRYGLDATKAGIFELPSVPEPAPSAGPVEEKAQTPMEAAGL